MKSHIHFPAALLLFIFLVSFQSNAQTGSYPILSMSIETTSFANDTSGGVPDLTDLTVFSAVMHIALYDTTNIDKIYVNLGDFGSSGNLLQQTFDWDISGSTGNGTSYSRNGYNLTLVLGNFMGMLSYHSDVSIKRTDTTVTDLINFTR